MTEEIMICPKCKLEYRKGFVVCAHCQIPLIEKPEDKTPQNMQGNHGNHTQTIALLEMIPGGLLILTAFVCCFIAFLMSSYLSGPAGPQEAVPYWWTMRMSIIPGLFLEGVAIAAMMKKVWLFVLIGSFISIPTIIGIPAFILTLKHKSEFTS